MDSAEFMEALEEIVKEKGIDKEVIFEAIETSLVSACKKNFGTSEKLFRPLFGNHERQGYC